MLVEVGLVVKKSEQRVWVQTVSKTSCSSCQVNSSCGTGLINKAFGEKSFITPLKNTLNAQVNDQVEVGIAEDLVVKASFLVYLLPLAVMLLSMFLWQWFFPQTKELYAILIAALALGLGFYWVKKITQLKAAAKDESPNKSSRSSPLEPVLLRIVSRPIEVTQIETS